MEDARDINATQNRNTTDFFMANIHVQFSSVLSAPCKEIHLGSGYCGFGGVAVG
jgi:hypothetical protein